MDYDYEYRRNHIPAFGSWDYNDNLPFTQCFESARQAGLLGKRHLYVAGDLYDTNVLTPAMILVPRPKCAKEGKNDAWVMCDYEYDEYTYAKEPPSPVSVPPHVVKPKAVDEDLYTISPELLRLTPRRKKWWWFSCCMQPSCVM